MIDPTQLANAQEERRLARIYDDVRRVLQVQPGDVAVIEVQTSSSDKYGFEVADAHIRRGEDKVEIGDALIDALIDALYDDLSSLAWKGLVGEDKSGCATIEVPGTPPPGPVGTWIRVDVESLRNWLSAATDPDEPESTRTYEDYDITRTWGLEQHVDGGYGETLTNLISDLPSEVLSSTIGAEPVVDGLWSADHEDPYLRVYVRLDADLRLCDIARTARQIVSSDGELPEIERVIGTIVNVVGICNDLIDALMVRFGH